MQHGAPGTETLFELVNKKVPKIEYPWMKDMKPSFVPTRVKWIETIPNQKKKNKDGQPSVEKDRAETSV